MTATMNRTPLTTLHRVNRALNFFEPYPDFLSAIHAYLGKEAVGCLLTVQDTPLPDFMCFVNDKELELKLYGQDGKITCGQHWTLYTTMEVAAPAFEAAYEQLKASFVPCSMQGGAGAVDLDVDMDEMPGDRLTRASVMALDNLAEQTLDPHDKLFSHLYALHMRANDMTFGEVLHFSPMASMVATALGFWTVRDPLLLEDAIDVRDLLANTLEEEVPCPEYRPFWAVHPFQFLHGEYNDQLFDEQVKTCAQAFVGDEALKTLVRGAADLLFAELAQSSDLAKFKYTTIKHKNLTFEIHCGAQSIMDDSSNGTSRSTSYAGGSPVMVCPTTSSGLEEGVDSGQGQRHGSGQ